MAKNKPYDDNARKGAVTSRSQFFNPKINRWIKRDTVTGRIMDVKADSNKFKGVRREN